MKKPIRGGIDVGLGINITADEIYGPALERPYRLESRVAAFPRVVVGDDLWNYLNHVENQHAKSPLGRVAISLATGTKKFITTDSDGQRILNFLGDQIASLWSADERRELFPPAYSYVIEQHGCWTQRNNGLLRDRYSRLREYFEAHRKLWES